MVEIERGNRRSIPGRARPSRRAKTGENRRAGTSVAPAAAAVAEAPAARGGSASTASRLHFTPPAIDPESSAIAAAHLLLGAIGDALQHHVEQVLDGGDAEAVHDLRVTLRRARCLLGPLRGVFSRVEKERLRDGARWLADLTGPSRDLELLREQLQATGEDLADEDRRAVDSLAASVGRDRERAHAALCEGLRSPRYARLIEAWRSIAASGVSTEEDRPIGKLAAEAIERAWRRLIRHGRALDDKSAPEDLHQVRIDGKKLRYLLELFRSAYPDVDLGPTIGCLKALQDCLGDLNDARVQQEALRRMAPRLAEEGSAATAALVLVGRLIERSRSAQASARRRFDQRFDALDSKDNRRCIRSLAP